MPDFFSGLSSGEAHISNGRSLSETDCFLPIFQQDPKFVTCIKQSTVTVIQFLGGTFLSWLEGEG